MISHIKVKTIIKTLLQDLSQKDLSAYKNFTGNQAGKEIMAVILDKIIFSISDELPDFWETSEFPIDKPIIAAILNDDRSSKETWVLIKNKEGELLLYEPLSGDKTDVSMAITEQDFDVWIELPKCFYDADYK